jgi:hypothetical protein
MMCNFLDARTIMAAINAARTVDESNNPIKFVKNGFKNTIEAMIATTANADTTIVGTRAVRNPETLMHSKYS